MVHWVQASSFLLLLATGLMISITSLESLVGHRALLREVHLATAFFFVFGPAIVALAGNYRSVREDAREVDRWTRDDLRWLAHPKVDPDPWTPPAGRFNAGQKLNAIFTVYSTLAFGVTGLILWQNRRFPFDVVSQANTIHTYLAYIALAIFLGHLYLSVVHPVTRASLRGIIFGNVDAGWARHHHPHWQPLTDHEPPINVGALTQSVVLLVILLEAALLLTRFGFEWLGANVTDPVTEALYRFSAVPGTLAHPATAVHSFDLGALIWFGLAVSVAFGLARREQLLPRMLPAPAKG